MKNQILAWWKLLPVLIKGRFYHWYMMRKRPRHEFDYTLGGDHHTMHRATPDQEAAYSRDLVRRRALAHAEEEAEFLKRQQGS